MTYNNNYTGKNYSGNRRISRSASAIERFLCFFAFIIYIVKCLAKNEAVVMTFKVASSLLCFACLVSVAYHVSVGALHAFPAILIALALLGAVAFIFSGDNR